MASGCPGCLGTSGWVTLEWSRPRASSNHVTHHVTHRWSRAGGTKWLSTGTCFRDHSTGTCFRDHVITTFVTCRFCLSQLLKYFLKVFNCCSVKQKKSHCQKSYFILTIIPLKHAFMTTYNIIKYVTIIFIYHWFNLHKLLWENDVNAVRLSWQFYFFLKQSWKVIKSWKVVLSAVVLFS